MCFSSDLSEHMRAVLLRIPEQTIGKLVQPDSSAMSASSHACYSFGDARNGGERIRLTCDIAFREIFDDVVPRQRAGTVVLAMNHCNLRVFRPCRLVTLPKQLCLPKQNFPSREISLLDDPSSFPQRFRSYRHGVIVVVAVHEEHIYFMPGRISPTEMVSKPMTTKMSFNTAIRASLPEPTSLTVTRYPTASSPRTRSMAPVSLR